MKLLTTILALPLIMTCSMAFADATATTAATPAATAVTTTAATTTTTVTTPATTNMSLSAILQQLNTAGFVCVKKIEMENGGYEATAMDKTGQAFKLKINPQTGVVIKKHSVMTMDKKMMTNMPVISMTQATANIEKAGYTEITEIKCPGHHDYYRAKAVDANGKKVKLEVNKTTGTISQA